MTAIYDIHKTFRENYDNFPLEKIEIPARNWPDRKNWHTFLGYPIASRIGVPACPVMTSKGIALASSLGFDILTYKTIRSRAHPPHPLPNIYFIKPEILKENNLQEPIYCASNPSEDSSKIAITNSFGNASFAPDEVIKDISLAKDSLKPGQILIVSIYGEPNKLSDETSEFVAAANLAKNAGADIIEINLSCPNVIGANLNISSKTIYTIVNAVVNATNPLPVIVKLGWTLKDKLSDVLITIADAGGRGICAINTIPMQVIDSKHLPVFGGNRQTSGVSGYPIRELALSFIERAQQVNQQKNLGLAIAGTGGVTQPQHFIDLYNAGADVALSATGMMWNPYLAQQYHDLFK